MENFITGISISAIGISVVVLVLVGISYLVQLLQIFSKPKKIENPIEEAVPAVIEETVSPIIDESAENFDIIAVITAAIAANLNIPEDQFIIRSIKRAGNWNETARRERQARKTLN